MSFSPVEYVWLVPAIPLAAMLIIFFVIRPIEALTTPHQEPAATGAGGHGGHGDHGDAHPAEYAAAGETAAASTATATAVATPASEAQKVAEDTHDAGASTGGADHEHGGSTTGWGMVSSVLGVGALVLSTALSLAIAWQFINDKTLQADGFFQHLYTWFTFGNLQYTIDFRVDTLTAVMLVVVTSVSLLVHLYSVGYMAGDPGYARFFIELLIFTVSMLILVLAANFLTLFIGWELVGLSSYLLVGFWFYHAPPPPGSEVPYPPPASLKAFVTTRLGDFGFLIGILILFVNTGTFQFTTLNTATKTFAAHDQAALTLAMILVFCGAVGKSAQFPLHVWLPDAMAGPTPVSALIHAATMVAAGVYLVARLFPIYAEAAGPQSLAVVGYIGAFTALFAATIALTQNDIKGVLAFSTISQLGYMFAGLAVAPTNAVGTFHLFTHAFFKALLFLGSGSVIHAVANQDMRKMGGLARAMPITAFTFLIATLSISGIFPLSGFWSKDPIIGLAWERGNYAIYGMTLATAVLTAFYMFRLYFRTFGGVGAPFAGFWGDLRQYRGEGHPHESPWVMTLPLQILAALTVLIGLAGFSIGAWPGMNSAFADFLHGGAPVGYEPAPLPDTLTLVGLAAGVVGIVVAWSVYALGAIPSDVLMRNPVGAWVYRVLYHRYYLDELYMLIIKYVVIGISNGAVLFDRYVIDGIVNGTARAVRGLGDLTRRSETGELQSYGAAMFGGALIIIIAFFIAIGAIGR
jgi:proton-translocating NADH-quinone oxidoreductase chain L